jgi:hypothetical protein
VNTEKTAINIVRNHGFGFNFSSIEYSLRLKEFPLPILSSQITFWNEDASTPVIITQQNPDARATAAEVYPANKATAAHTKIKKDEIKAALQSRLRTHIRMNTTKNVNNFNKVLEEKTVEIMKMAIKMDE